MRRPIASAALLGAGLLACGSTAEPDDGTSPHALRAGLWETNVRVGDLSSLGLSSEEAAELKRLVESRPPERLCLPAGPPKVGAPFLGGRCTYSRVADHGASADRIVSCPPQDGKRDSVRLTGTTGPKHYRLRILSRRTDVETGKLLDEVETYEEGRWIGPCPDAR